MSSYWQIIAYYIGGILSNTCFEVLSLLLARSVKLFRMVLNGDLLPGLENMQLGTLN